MKKTILMGVLFVFVIGVGLFAGTYSGGSGTSGDPYQIGTLADLEELSNTSGDWSSHFIQTADIDASDTQNWNGGEGFSPIGYWPNRFYGTYDGQDYLIEYLFINRISIDDVGLFGAINSSEIINLCLNNSTISGKNNTGGLIGYSFSSLVSNCYNTGSITGEDNTGGLVGYNRSNSSINNCFSNANVNGFARIGGLVGRNDDNSTINNCYCNGDVNGGLYYTGGLVGTNEDNSMINFCFSTSFVNGINYVGGLLGANVMSSIVNNSFWDIESSGTTFSNGGTGKTTAEMKDVATFTNLTTVGLDTPWDFINNPFDDTDNDDIWSMDGLRFNDGYPYLSWQNSGDPPTPVTLSSFNAVQTSENFAQINWSTQSENGLIGYNIYRNTNNNLQTAAQANPFIIEGTNTTTEQNYSFTDSNVNFEQTYYYWLESVEMDNETDNFGPIHLTIETPEIEELPETTFLSAAYPNPFKPETTIKFSIKENESAVFSIYNAKGQVVVSESYEAGNHQYNWNGENYSSGIYFYKLQTDGYSEIKKMLLMR